ncbi:MAG: TPM domain-containing protein [Flavobacteriales bacterium]|nr:TPM domain-containing protein [Flavobacteriales bacterium]
MYAVFGSAEEQMIEHAIALAEKETSGEIRVHVDNRCKENVLDRAVYVFKQLDMHQTELRNGVLIYVAIQDHKLAIIGDQGINKMVQNDFWEKAKDLMIENFKKGYYTEGICKAIEQAGNQLKSYFPYQDDDVNELPNQVSFGK